MRNGEWLRRAGPFEISKEPVRQNEGEIEFWHRATQASRKEADGLRERLNRSEELLQDLDG